jgi:hypothetical protein
MGSGLKLWTGPDASMAYKQPLRNAAWQTLAADVVCRRRHSQFLALARVTDIAPQCEVPPHVGNPKQAGDIRPDHACKRE